MWSLTLYARCRLLPAVVSFHDLGGYDRSDDCVRYGYGRYNRVEVYAPSMSLLPSVEVLREYARQHNERGTRSALRIVVELQQPLVDRLTLLLANAVGPFTIATLTDAIDRLRKEPGQ